MMPWFALAVAILALAIACLNLYRVLKADREHRRRMEAATRNLRTQTVADEFDLAFDLPDEVPHVTSIGVDMDPDEYDPNDLTKGGSFSFPQEHLVDLRGEREGAAVPHYPNMTERAAMVDPETRGHLDRYLDEVRPTPAAPKHRQD